MIYLSGSVYLFTLFPPLGSALHIVAGGPEVSLCKMRLPHTEESKLHHAIIHTPLCDSQINGIFSQYRNVL